MQLKGTFLITGGTRGLGRAVSVQFGTAGATVVANYLRNAASANELKAQADREGWRLELCRADLTMPEGLKAVEAALPAELAGIVHCAATGTHRSLAGLTSRHLDFTMRLNVGSFFDLVKTLQPRLRPGSAIVGISSPGATRAIPDYTVVGASKGALEALCRHLAAELGPSGVRVNIIAPGAVATDVWKAIPDGATKLAAAAQRSPLRRLVTPEEVAQATVFLCSPASSGINGQTITIDGGTGIAAWC